MWKGVRVKWNACEQEGNACGKECMREGMHAERNARGKECMREGMHAERNACGQECMQEGVHAGRNACGEEMDACGTGVHMELDCECIFGRTRSAYVCMGAAVVHAYGYGQWTERFSLTGTHFGTQSLLKLILRN